jgi:hypothetical protein
MNSLVLFNFFASPSDCLDGFPLTPNQLLCVGPPLSLSSCSSSRRFFIKSLNQNGFHSETRVAGTMLHPNTLSFLFTSVFPSADMFEAELMITHETVFCMQYLLPAKT